MAKRKNNKIIQVPLKEELLNQIDATAGVVAGSRAAFIREACQQRLKSLRAVERKALDYYVADLDIRLKKENIAALLKQIDISDAPQKYFDDTYLTRAIGSR
jgi:metal-responsive CopG/Arc/MetJ family transcriptional regulator